MQDEELDAYRRWASSSGEGDEGRTVSPAVAPPSIAPPPPAPPGFGYVWNPPHGYVMVSLNPQPPMPQGGPAFSAPMPHNPYVPRPNESNVPYAGPANGGNRYAPAFQPRCTMLLKSGSRDPWEEKLAQLPELQVQGAPPPGNYDAMQGHFNPAFAQDLALVQADIRSMYPAAAEGGWNPLEGTGAESVASIRHVSGSVAPLKG